MNKKSGQYLQQVTGYKAFIPNPLTPPPTIKIIPEREKLIKQAENGLIQLSGVGFLLPNPDLFITMAIRKEALLSSQIEGTQATMTDVLTYETWEDVANFDDVEEVVNYIKALKSSIAMLDRLPLGVRVIQSAHAILLQGERGKNKMPGEFRRSQNWIGPSLKNALFVPPPHDVAKELMSDLEKFMNKAKMHPLIQCALIHYQFETIHPFLDGNGRIGRLLIDLFIFWKHLLDQPLLYISLFFKLHRQEYFDRLMKVREDGDFEQWIDFFLKAIIWSTEHAIVKIKEVLLLQKALREKVLKEKKATVKSVKLLEQLFLKPLVTIKDVSSLLQVSYQGAENQVALFESLGILKEMTGQKRGKRFAFAPYLEVIEE